jgi:peptidoglycan/xylan/chitin deacetylase (PgdA/CDA1 family)
VLDLLREAGARATFFVIGKFVEAHPELVVRAHADGHEVGNHSQTHRTGGLPQQVTECAAVLRQLGITTPLFRPPCGRLPFGAFLRLWCRGYRTIFWSFDGRDSMRAEGKWRDETPDYTRIRAGDIVLMHDDNPRCVEELPLLLSAIRSRGLRSVTLSELFKDAAF